MTRRGLLAGLVTLGVTSCAASEVIESEPPIYKRCSFGAYAGKEPYGSPPAGLGEHYQLEDALGVKLSRMVWFANMDQPWPNEAAAQAGKTGHTPNIAWDTGELRLAEILNGSRDWMLDAFFERARDFPGTVVLRPWWEMNTAEGRYTMAYAGPGRTAESLQQYKDAWAYVHHRAKAVNGARNVSFFFCANGSDIGDYRMEEYFPGVDYVDEIGFDTYNELHWGGPWTPFEAKLAPMYSRVAALHPTAAISIGELGTIDSGGPAGTSKATWLKDMFTSKAFPRLKHIDFFSVRKDGVDWRLDETQEAIAVCREYLSEQ